MIRRYLLTLFSTLLLLGFYTVYAQLSRQLLKQPARGAEVHQRRVVGSPESIGPRSSQQAAMKHLPDAPWAMNARVKIHADGMFLFFNDRVQENEKKELKVSPIAIVWETAKPGQKKEPITILAESATFVFDQPVELSEIRTHMMQDAMLRGEVIIKGPNGLKITGRNFIFSRAAQHLRSDHPVHFRMQQNEGIAKNIQLNLKMLDGPAQRDNPLIQGISDILISGHLEMNLVPKPGKPPVRVQCEREFHYDVDKQLATLDEDVFVVRTDRHGLVDSMDCDSLQLQFANLTADAKKPPGINSSMNTDMELQTMHATGSPVVCKSQKHHLVAKGEEFEYDVKKKNIIINDSQIVEINYLDTELKTPRLEVTLDEQDEPTFAYCAGPGQLKHLNKNPARFNNPNKKKNAILADAFWSDSLTFAPDTSSNLEKQNVITLTGDAMIRSPVQNSGLIANKLRLWLEIVETVDMATPGSKVSKKMKIHLAKAEGKVAISSPYLEGNYQTLTLNFKERSDQLLSSLLKRSTANGVNDTETIQQTSGEQPQRGLQVDRMNLHIDADHLGLDVLHNQNFSRYHVAHVETEGTFTAAGKLPDAEDPFQISGQRVEIENAGEKKQKFRLLGSTQQFASIQNGNMRINGIELDIDTEKNVARVLKNGSLQIPVKTDLQGNPLEKLQLLEVSWTDQMKFAGQKVHFVGSVRATLETSVITCEELWVTLDQPISFYDSTKNKKPQIAEIECIDGVNVKMNRFEMGKLTSISTINVATFKINHQTGEMFAQGPGIMDFWQKRTGKSTLGIPEATLIGSPANSNNSPNNKSTGWDYTKITFAGKMTGNTHKKKGQLNDRVNVLHGPVDRPLAKFTRDNRPANSAWLRCEQLEILAKAADFKSNPKLNPKTPFVIELLASKNAEIEGDRFLVRSDLISFDQQRNLFTIRALENRHVTMWHYENPQSPRSRYDVKMILLSPDGNILKLDRTLGATGSR